MLPFNRFGMSQFALIACRVPLETKARVRQLAEREGITESTLLRQLLEVVLRTAGLGEAPPVAVSAMPTTWSSGANELRTNARS